MTWKILLSIASVGGMCGVGYAILKDKQIEQKELHDQENEIYDDIFEINDKEENKELRKINKNARKYKFLKNLDSQESEKIKNLIKKIEMPENENNSFNNDDLILLSTYWNNLLPFMDSNFFKSQKYSKLNYIKNQNKQHCSGDLYAMWDDEPDKLQKIKIPFNFEDDEDFLIFVKTGITMDLQNHLFTINRKSDGLTIKEIVRKLKNAANEKIQIKKSNKEPFKKEDLEKALIVFEKIVATLKRIGEIEGMSFWELNKTGTILFEFNIKNKVCLLD